MLLHCSTEIPLFTLWLSQLQYFVVIAQHLLYWIELLDH